MKKLKMNDVLKMSVEDIQTKINELKQESLNLRVQLATGNLENTARIKSVKKNIAILKTALNQKNREKDLKEA